jgi:hypothetical protein
MVKQSQPKNMSIREFLTVQGFENATVGSPTMKLFDYLEHNPYNMCYDIDRNTAVTLYDHIRNGFFNVSLWSKVHRKRWDYLLKTKNKSLWLKKKKECADKAIKKIITNTTPIIDNIADIILGLIKTTKFEVGKTYWRSNNWDGRTTREEYKVVRKTKCFVSIEDHWEREKIKRYKIQYNDEGNEYIMLGRYANAPGLWATDKV